MLAFTSGFNTTGSLRIAHKEFNDSVVRLTLQVRMFHVHVVPRDTHEWTCRIGRCSVR